MPGVRKDGVTNSNSSQGGYRMKKQLSRAAIALAVLGILIAPTMAGPLKGHPHLEAARRHVNQALEACRAAHAEDPQEFGGHRARAEELLNQAKAELDAAAQFANTHH